MSKPILFSPVGGTDPIRNLHDGPLLHIVRYYQPKKVYLFYTKEMYKKKKEVNSALKKLDSKIQIEIIESNIIDAHNFDIYIDIFEGELRKINKENPNAEILVNISSGTPQMNSALAIEVVASYIQLRPIQVSSPEKGWNIDVAHGGIAEENLDNLMEDGKYLTENRCLEPDILSFRKMSAKRDILSLINSYEYRGALNKIKENNTLFTKDVEDLIEYAMYRQDDNVKYRKIFWDQTFDYTKDVRGKKAIDYYCILKNKGMTGELSYFTLLLKPLAEYMGEDFIGDFQENEIRSVLNDFYNGRYKEHYIGTGRKKRLSYNLEQFICIMEYKEKNKALIKHFKEIQNLIPDRNVLAHTLHRTDELNIGRLLKTLQHLIRMIYGNKVNPKSFELYENINQKIKQLL